jgi:hypothetical protein
MALASMAAPAVFPLFGHARDPDRLLHIPYLDYLAAVSQCRSPPFSLEPFPGFTRCVDRFKDDPTIESAFLESLKPQF